MWRRKFQQTSAQALKYEKFKERCALLYAFSAFCLGLYGFLTYMNENHKKYQEQLQKAKEDPSAITGTHITIRGKGFRLTEIVRVEGTEKDSEELNDVNTTY